MRKLSALYFSATATTRKCVITAASAMNIPLASSINLADRDHASLPVFSIPVYRVVGAYRFADKLPEITKG